MKIGSAAAMEIRAIQPEWNEGQPIFASGSWLSSQGSETGWVGGYLGGALAFA
jgi:hypothetical protein